MDTSTSRRRDKQQDQDLTDDASFGSPSEQPMRVPLGHLDLQDGLTVDSARSVQPIEGVRGLQAVREALAYESFPMSLSDVDYAIGDVELSDGAGGMVAIRNLTDSIPSREFADPEEVMEALASVRDSLLGKTAA